MCASTRKKYLKEWYLKNRERVLVYQNDYNLKNKEKKTEYDKKHYLKNKTRKKEYRLKNLNHGKEWRQKNRKRLSKYYSNYVKNRIKVDESFAVLNRLRPLIRHAFRKYSTTGKIMRSKDYGIDYEGIVKHLGSCPGDRRVYHIDHIRPLCSFDLNDLEQVKLAFAPENHQWLPALENIAKGGKW